MLAWAAADVNGGGRRVRDGVDGGGAGRYTVCT